jgi:hypothetical protein
MHKREEEHQEQDANCASNICDGRHFRFRPFRVGELGSVDVE